MVQLINFNSECTRTLTYWSIWDTLPHACSLKCFKHITVVTITCRLQLLVLTGLISSWGERYFSVSSYVLSIYKLSVTPEEVSELHLIIHCTGKTCMNAASCTLCKARFYSAETKWRKSFEELIRHSWFYFSLLSPFLI